jgi:hypothetical protein
MRIPLLNLTDEDHDWTNASDGLPAPRQAFRSRSVPSPEPFCYVLFIRRSERMEVDMGFGRGVLFWLLGIPIPIIILLALFWHH